MKRLCLIMLVFISTAALYSEAGLTLQSAVRMAIENNQELQMAKEDVIIAEQNYNEVRGQLFPQINLNASYGLSWTTLPNSATIPSFSISDALTDASDNENFIAGTLDMMMERMLPTKEQEEITFAGQIALSQPIFLGGKLINGIRVLDRVKSIQEKRYELELQNMIITVINSYFDLYMAQEGLAIQKQALSNAELHFNRVENLYNQGLLSEYDKLRAELEVSRLYPEVLNFENLVNLAEENFRRITGFTEEMVLFPVLDEKTTEYSAFEISLEAALGLAHDTRIELYLTNLMTDIYQVQLNAEKMNYFPNVLLQADISTFNQSRSISDFSFNKDNFGNSRSIGVVFQMPLFTGLSNTSTRIRAKSELRKAEYDAINLTELINLEIRQTWQSFIQSKRFLEIQEMNLGLAQRALNIAQTRFENQSGIQLEVFDAQIQFNAAQISLAEAKIRIIKDYFALNKALGNNLNNIIGEL